MLDSDNAFVVADIPGLIEGAHAGHGLGHEFLRHVERTGLLVHLVEAVPIDGSDPVQNYRMIRRELEQYSPALAERPELVVVTKMDLTGAAEAARPDRPRAGPSMSCRSRPSRARAFPSCSTRSASDWRNASRSSPPTRRIRAGDRAEPRPLARDGKLLNMLRIVADLGNSRLKWARLDEDGRLDAFLRPAAGRPSGLGGALGRLAPARGWGLALGGRVGQPARGRAAGSLPRGTRGQRR